MIDDFSEEDKGLFTFYRQQAELEEELKRNKRLRKLEKMRQVQQRKRKEEQAKMKIKNQETQKIEKAIEKQKEKEKIRLQKQAQRERKQRQRKQQLAEKARQKKPVKELHEPKYMSEKKFVRKKWGGGSVVIINGKDEKPLKFQYDQANLKSSENRKGTLKKIEEMINQQNHNRYFLQNKQVASAFGSQILQKSVLQDQDEINIKTKKSVPQSYFNQYSQEEQKFVKKRYLPVFSYQKLPQIHQNRKNPSTQLFTNKKMIHRQFEEALKSGDHNLIRKLRKSLKDDSIHKLKEDVQMIQRYEEIIPPESQRFSMNPKLTEKQKKLLDIIHNSRQLTKKSR